MKSNRCLIGSKAESVVEVSLNIYVLFWDKSDGNVHGIEIFVVEEI